LFDLCMAILLANIILDLKLQHGTGILSMLYGYFFLFQFTGGEPLNNKHK